MFLYNLVLRDNGRFPKYCHILWIVFCMPDVLIWIVASVLEYCDHTSGHN